MCPVGPSLAIDRMTTIALRRAALDYTYRLDWYQIRSVYEHQEMLQQLREILQELELRGDQLSLPFGEPTTE